MSVLRSACYVLQSQLQALEPKVADYALEWTPISEKVTKLKHQDVFSRNARTIGHLWLLFESWVPILVNEGMDEPGSRLDTHYDNLGWVFRHDIDAMMS